MNPFTARTVLAGTATLVVGAAIATAMVKLGPPSEQRLRRLDARRVDDLGAISRAVDLYWTRRSQLPASIDDLRAANVLLAPARDPLTEQPYGYRQTSAAGYELCAEFQVASEQRTGTRPGDFWTHTSGRQCFPLTARDMNNSRARD